MRLSVPRIGKIGNNAMANPSGKRKILSIVIKLLVLAVLVFGVILLLNKHHKKNQIGYAPTTGPTTTNQLEADLSSTEEGYLKSGNYTIFQDDQINLAQHYLNAKDISNAERIENNALAKVPKDKIVSETFNMMVQIQQAKKDTANTKKYLKLLIAQDQKEGNTQAASAWQSYLENLK